MSRPMESPASKQQSKKTTLYECTELQPKSNARTRCKPSLKDVRSDSTGHVQDLSTDATPDSEEVRSRPMPFLARLHSKQEFKRHRYVLSVYVCSCSCPPY